MSLLSIVCSDELVNILSQGSHTVLGKESTHCPYKWHSVRYHSMFTMFRLTHVLEDAVGLVVGDGDVVFARAQATVEAEGSTRQA